MGGHDLCEQQHVAAAAVEAHGEQGVDVTIFLRLSNDNTFPVLIEGADYTVHVNGKQVKQEQAAIGVRLIANSAEEYEVGAILDEGKGAAVWVVQGDQVRRQPVTVVQVQDGNAQVVGALGLGERIVALGAHLLSEGAQVRLESEAPSTATTSTASSVSTGASRE